MRRHHLYPVLFVCMRFFEQARAELTEEIQEVVRMAYERRRQLHLAALAAGRVQSATAVD